MSNIYKEGINRKQQMFFPPTIDEYVELLDMAKRRGSGAMALS